jgi:hypothetical protein
MSVGYQNVEIAEALEPPRIECAMPVYGNVAQKMLSPY